LGKYLSCIWVSTYLRLPAVAASAAAAARGLWTGCANAASPRWLQRSQLPRATVPPRQIGGARARVKKIKIYKNKIKNSAPAHLVGAGDEGRGGLEEPKKEEDEDKKVTHIIINIIRLLFFFFFFS